MSDLQEVIKKTDEAFRLIVQTQEVNDRKYADKEQITKISQECSSILGEVQELKAQQEAAAKETKELEKAICRMPAQLNSDLVEQAEYKKYRDEMINYLRTGSLISTESWKEVCNDIAKKTLIARTEDEVNLHAKKLMLTMPSKGLIEGIDPQGGYFVIPQRSQQRVTRIFETSPMRQVASVGTTSSNVLQMIIDDDEPASSGWLGEGQITGTNKTPNIGLLSIPIHKIAARSYATQEMIDDAGFDIENWLMTKIVAKLAREQNTAFVVGDGSNKPKGFLSYPAWTTNSTISGVKGIYERGKLERISTGVPGGFNSGDDIKLLKNSLLEEYQPDAVFVMQRSTFESVITLKTAIGSYLLNPNSLANGDEQILLGKKVVFFNDMQELAANSLSIAYGDFKMGYTILDRVGLRIIRDIYTQADLIVYTITQRVGGAVTNYQSIKVLKNG